MTGLTWTSPAVVLTAGVLWVLLVLLVLRIFTRAQIARSRQVPSESIDWTARFAAASHAADDLSQDELASELWVVGTRLQPAACTFETRAAIGAALLGRAPSGMPSCIATASCEAGNHTYSWPCIYAHTDPKD